MVAVANKDDPKALLGRQLDRPRLRKLRHRRPQLLPAIPNLQRAGRQQHLVLGLWDTAARAGELVVEQGEQLARAVRLDLR